MYLLLMAISVQGLLWPCFMEGDSKGEKAGCLGTGLQGLPPYLLPRQHHLSEWLLFLDPPN